MSKIYEVIEQYIISDLPIYTEAPYHNNSVGYYTSLSLAIEAIKAVATDHENTILLDYKVKVINTDTSYAYIDKYLHYDRNGELKSEIKEDNTWPITNELLEVGDIVIYHPESHIRETKLGIISQAPEVGGMRNFYEILLGLNKDDIVYTSNNITKIEIPPHHSLISTREVGDEEIFYNEKFLYMKEMLENRLEHFKRN